MTIQGEMEKEGKRANGAAGSPFGESAVVIVDAEAEFGEGIIVFDFEMEPESVAGGSSGWRSRSVSKGSSTTKSAKRGC
jgi:hypothetical protein